MNRLLHVTVHSVLVLAGVAAQDRGAAQTADKPDAPATGLFRGWLAEHVDRNQKAAQLAYQQALTDAELPPEQRLVSSARLVELAQLQGDRTTVERLRPALTDLLAGFRGVFGIPSLPHDEFAQALAMPAGQERTAALEELRARLGERRAPTRRVVAITLERLQRKEALRLRELSVALRDARGAGDRGRVRELQREIRRLRAGPRSTRSALNWRLLITRRVLQGRFEEAERYARRLGLRRSAREIAPARRESSVREFQRRVRRRLRQPDTTPLERAVLTELRTRIDQLAEEGRWDEAVSLIGRLPFPE